MNSYRVIFLGYDGEEMNAYYFARSEQEARNLFGGDFGDLIIDRIEEESEDPSEHDAFQMMLDMV